MATYWKNVMASVTLVILTNSVELGDDRHYRGSDCTTTVDSGLGYILRGYDLCDPGHLQLSLCE